MKKWYNEKMNKKEKLKKIIEEKVYITADKEKISDGNGGYRENGFLFDFRRVLMKAETLNLVSEIFWEEYKEKYPFQIGTLEVAGIPLAIGLNQFIYNQGKKDMNTFFIRKSRKKSGLLRMIEGVIEKDKKIILVDDIINSGKSFVRQIKVLEELGYKVDEVWAILKWRDDNFYTFFNERNIKIKAIFEMNDFKNLGLKNKETKAENFEAMSYPFEVLWKFSAPNPNYYYVVPKSNPVIDEDKIYFGSDSGWFWAINQNDGSVAWKFKVGYHTKGKSIFSTPVLYKNLVIFGAYDGNLYALNKETGKKVWINFEADWIGSSPTISEKLGLGFVGLEFGLIRKRGGIMAFDLKTGKLIWKDITPSYTHSSPLYLKKTKEVVIGSNDGIVRLYDAKKGIKKWEFKTDEISEEEILAGFSKKDIKNSFAYDEKLDYLAFGTTDGYTYIIKRKNGELVFKHKAEFGYYSTPVIYNHILYTSSLDKHLYAIDLITKKEIWKWNAGARIFASPKIINDKIYIGANTGRLTELSLDGKELGFITIAERITGVIAYNPKTKIFFLPSYANEIYALKKRDKKILEKEKKEIQEKMYQDYLKFTRNELD